MEAGSRMRMLLAIVALCIMVLFPLFWVLSGTLFYVGTVPVVPEPGSIVSIGPEGPVYAPELQSYTAEFWQNRNFMEVVAITVSGLGSLIAALAVAIIFWRMLQTRRPGFDQTVEAGEETMLQGLHSGFSRMELRVEALETILLERVSRDAAVR